MAIHDQVDRYVDGLEDVARHLGLDRKTLAKGEGPDQIVLGPVPGDAAVLGRIGQRDLDRWFALFGATLSIDFEVAPASSAPAKSCSANARIHRQAALGGFLAHCARHGAGIDLTLKLRKEPLAHVLRKVMVRDGFAAAAETEVLLFFFAEGLSQLARLDDRRRGRLLLVLAPGRV